MSAGARRPPFVGQTLRDYSLVALGGLFVASLRIGWVLSGRALRPVGAIARTAREIQATGLSRRIQLNGPRAGCDLADTVDSTIDRYVHPLAAGRGLRLRYALGDELVCIGDPDALRQAAGHRPYRRRSPTSGATPTLSCRSDSGISSPLQSSPNGRQTRQRRRTVCASLQSPQQEASLRVSRRPRGKHEQADTIQSVTLPDINRL